MNGLLHREQVMVFVLGLGFTVFLAVQVVTAVSTAFERAVAMFPAPVVQPVR